MVSVSSTSLARYALAFVASLFIATAAQAQQPSVTAEVTPNPVANNQVAELTITINNGQPSGVPVPALPPPLQVTSGVSQSQQMSINNGVTSVTVSFTYQISCPQPGSFTIPPIDVSVGSQILKTQQLTVEVKPAAQIPAPSGRGPGQDNDLGQFEPILQIELPKTEFYQGEIVPIVARLYVLSGNRVNLRRIGLIEVEKADLAIQRFPQQPEQSYETLGNKSYTAFTFRSTLSALKAGKMVVGPAKVDVILGVAVGRGGFFGLMQEDQRKATVIGSESVINVLPLPAEGKPKGFGGAVGDFSMSATSSNAEVTVGDPVAVDVQVTGTGNFDAIQAPTLSDSAGWKLYPPKRYNVDNHDPNNSDLMNRRLGFNTIIVPEKTMPMVPPFEFTFFSPTTRQYTTLRSQPIPISIKAAPVVAGAPAASTSTLAAAAQKPAGPTPPPEADITDILMSIPATPHWASISTPLFSNKAFITFNILLALGLVALVVLTLMQRAAAKQAGSPARALADLLTQVQAANLSEAEFYRLAARYVQQATRGQSTVEAQSILTKYEALNFAGPSAGTAAIEKNERAEVIGLLKKIKPVFALVLMAILSLGTVQAGENEAYQAAADALQKSDFKGAQTQAEAAVKEGHIGPEIFTLLGHANYKQKRPGTAAMWYQRAQLFPNAAPELRQNLRHIHDKVPFFTFQENEFLQRMGLFFARNTWAWIASLGVWACLFALLMAWRTGRWKLLSIIPLGAICAVIGLVGWLVRPSYQEVEPLAFVTSDKAQAHTAATQTSGSVITVPPGSVVRKLDVRGNWTYVEIPQNNEDLRGWLPTNQLEPVWPYDAAKLP